MCFFSFPGACWNFRPRTSPEAREDLALAGSLGEKSVQ